MFKAFTASFLELPPDVNREVFETDETEGYFFEDYLVVQMDGKTISCKSESQLTDGIPMIMELMELAYYLGVLDGVKHEQGFVGGRTEQNRTEHYITLRKRADMPWVR